MTRQTVMRPLGGLTVSMTVLGPTGKTLYDETSASCWTRYGGTMPVHPYTTEPCMCALQ